MLGSLSRDAAALMIRGAVGPKRLDLATALLTDNCGAAIVKDALYLRGFLWASTRLQALLTQKQFSAYS